MTRRTIALLAAGVALTAGGTAHAATHDSGDGGEPGSAANPVVAVEGDAGNGFGVHYLDGSAIFPPTDSEALAECSEYDTRRARIRCRVEVRTWYRDLAVLQAALDHAHAQQD